MIVSVSGKNDHLLREVCAYSFVPNLSVCTSWSCYVTLLTRQFLEESGKCRPTVLVRLGVVVREAEG